MENVEELANRNIGDKGSSVKTPSRIHFYTVIVIQQFLGALAFPITKFGLEEVPPFTFAFFRFLIATVVMLALLPWLGDKVRIPRHDAIKIAALGVMIVVLNQAMFIYGQDFTTATHGSLLFAFTPIFIYIFSLIILKERFTLRRGVGVTLAVIGAVIIVSQQGVEFSADMLYGDFIILIAVIVWGLYTVLGKPLVERYGAFKVTAYAALSGTIVYFPFGIYTTWNVDLGAISAAGWGAVIYLGTGLSIGAYVLWYWAIKYFDASRVAPFHNLQPFIVVALAYIMKSETITYQFALGGALIIAGVLAVELNFAKKKTTLNN